MSEMVSGMGYIGTTPGMLYQMSPRNRTSILGLHVDYRTGTFTRLGKAQGLTSGKSFDRFTMFGGRRRCNVADNGTITCYYGDTGYREDGSNGQVMVYQPKFWYKVDPLVIEPITGGIGHHLRAANYYVSDGAAKGFKVHPAFFDEFKGEVDYILMSAYEGSIYDTSEGSYILDDAQVMDNTTDKLSSIAGTKPASGKTQDLTRVKLEQMAKNRGAGWHLDTIKVVSAIQILMLIELGTLNTQSAIGKGVTDIPDNPTTDNNSIVTGGTSSLGNATGMAPGVNGQTAVAYRGEENPWGNIWKLVNGANVWGDGKMLGGVPYICTDYNYEESKNTGNYKSAGFTLPNANGYISAMGYSKDFEWLLMPSECNGNSAGPVGDYGYFVPDLNGYRTTLLGGSCSNNLMAGGFYWFFANASNSHGRTVDGRLVYVPQTNNNLFNGKLYKGFIENNDGAINHNNAWPNSLYSDLIFCRKEKTYICTEIQDVPNRLRIRVFNQDGSYKENANIGKLPKYTADTDCYIRVLFHNGITDAEKESFTVKLYN